MSSRFPLLVFIAVLPWGQGRSDHFRRSGTSDQSGLQELRHQVESLTQSLVTYVQGYSDLRTKYGELRRDLTNVTNQLTMTTAAYDTMVKKYEALEQKYNDTKEVMSKLSKTLSTAERKISESERKLNELNLEMNQTALAETQQTAYMSNISSRMSRLEHSLSLYARKPSPIAFQARLSSKITPTKNTNIIFNVTTNNDGAYYSASSGVFTVPESGIYLFAVTITTRAKDPDAYLMKNGADLLPLYDHSDITSGNYDYRQASASVVTHLNVGDRVWVEWNGSEAGAVIQSNHESVFSGSLLQRDAI